MPHAVVSAAKIKDAHRAIRACFGGRGIWASPFRYAHMCWTRDFVFSLPALARLEHDEPIRRHLLELIRRQKPTGQIPTWFCDGKIGLMAKKAKRIQHALLQIPRFRTPAPLSWFGLRRFAADNELLFAIGLLYWSYASDDADFLREHQHAAFRALGYVERELMKDGLVVGDDWRDANYGPGRRALLSNNCLLYCAYRLRGANAKAAELRERIRAKFLRDGYFVDHPETNAFQLSGNALAILHGVAEAGEYNSIFDRAKELEREFGYASPGVVIPPQNMRERRLLRRLRERGIAFGVENLFFVLAELYAGRIDLAMKDIEKLNRLAGFPECWDAGSGARIGSPDQLWTAALYLVAAETLSDAIEAS